MTKRATVTKRAISKKKAEEKLERSSAKKPSPRLSVYMCHREPVTWVQKPEKSEQEHFLSEGYIFLGEIYFWHLWRIFKYTLWHVVLCVCLRCRWWFLWSAVNKIFLECRFSVLFSFLHWRCWCFGFVSIVGESRHMFSFYFFLFSFEFLFWRRFMTSVTWKT